MRSRRSSSHSAIATVANDGVAFARTSCKYIREHAHRRRPQLEREPTHTVPLKPEHLAVIKAALVGVARGGHQRGGVPQRPLRLGAARPAPRRCTRSRATKYKAHLVDERMRDHAWYIAYAPADKPAIALAVLVENGGFGAQAAAPIARQVFDYYLTGELKAEPAPALPAVPPDAEDESD